MKNLEQFKKERQPFHRHSSMAEVALAAGQVMEIIAKILNSTRMGDNVETSKINMLVENLRPLAG